jgi:hypothetical protein
MHIGLIVGIGPAATDCYRRFLVSTFAQAGADLGAMRGNGGIRPGTGPRRPSMLRDQPALHDVGSTSTGSGLPSMRSL